MSVSVVLDRLDRVKQVKPGQWKAGCPCCRSRRGFPLYVTDASDRVLMHAFCGCSTADVLGALGLTINDLFERPLEHRVNEKSNFKLQNSEVLSAVASEATVLAVIASDFLDRKELDETTWARLAATVQRLTDAADYINSRGR